MVEKKLLDRRPSLLEVHMRILAILQLGVIFRSAVGM
ncbi:hypothetical protein XOCgx_1888 [Xanthomonas oryzae pv. oryzicola]|nr:hypothetical protein XOCgx_1888 [Xanthomonas oryzae pv. oryzicola]